MATLMWFREDLRLDDNTALYHAMQVAEGGLIAVYIISPQEWRAHDMAACRVDFILRNLKILSADLAALHVPLLIREAETAKDVAKILIEIAETYKVVSLYFNQQYEIDEARRDQKVEAMFQKRGCKVFSYTDQVILAPGEVLTAAGNYYTVFTPFKKAWLKQANQQKLTLWPALQPQKPLGIKSDAVPKEVAGFNSVLPDDLWPAGEQFAQQRLQQFLKEKIQLYAKQRDFPAAAGTSALSPYLSAGVVSVRQCLHAVLAMDKTALSNGEDSVQVWVNELIWREFYKHIIYGFPRICMGQAFRLPTERLQWSNNHEHFRAWQEGMTGYPLVDAAMRQLKHAGWMHNRLRMLVAMFLVKDLWIDWRWGERYFMQHLIDGDFAANNGGWQWSASTGTDAVPYFRIFNPTSQSQKFDPEGVFIRRYCPELAHLDNKAIHAPYDRLSPAEAKTLDYPKPIVDHAKARADAIAAFQKI